MKWIELDKSELPTKEVLVANFQPRTFGYKEKLIGYVYMEDDGKFSCESEDSMLNNCTHYIDIHQFDVEGFEKK